jgi:hypothetical protein
VDHHHRHPNPTRRHHPRLTVPFNQSKNSVISTEATDSFTVRCAVERPPYLVFVLAVARLPQQRRTNIDSTPYFAPEIHVSPIYTGEDMSTSTISVDEFQALEQKVLRAVEVVKREREARATAEAEVANLRAQLAESQSLSTMVESELTTLTKEREAVRQRVEKMLQQMDELL